MVAGRFLTGVADTDYLILMELDPDSLFYACATNQYAQALCSRESFWINRIVQDFGEGVLQYRPPIESAQQQYRYLVSVMPVQTIADGRIDGIIANLVRDNMEVSGDWDRVAVIAGEHGRTNILEWMQLNNYEFEPNDVIRAAVQFGQLDVLDWLSKNGFLGQRNSQSMSFDAAKFGQTIVLDWLLENNLPINRNASLSAARHGHPGVLDWLIKHNIQFNQSFDREAVRYGNINVLDWMEARQIPIDSELVYIAVHASQYNIVDWFRQRGIYAPTLRQAGQ